VLQKKICEYCGKLFVPRKAVHRTCSYRCDQNILYNQNKKPKVKIIKKKWRIKRCGICGNKFKTIRNNRMYCGEECQKKAGKNWNKTNKKYKSYRSSKYSMEVAYPNLLEKYQTKGFNFQSISEMNYERRKWSIGVKERDGYICQRCNNRDDVKSHHIIPVSIDITKSLDLDNGITLCAECHNIGNEGSIHNLYKTNYTEKEFWDWFYSYKTSGSVEIDVQEIHV
jgi:5-methylcytosine-specific restriction endonuclease McrA